MVAVKNSEEKKWNKLRGDRRTFPFLACLLEIAYSTSTDDDCYIVKICTMV
jgi:hypothetical protein